MFVGIKKVGYLVDKLQINFVLLYICMYFFNANFISPNGLLINKM